MILQNKAGKKMTLNIGDYELPWSETSPNAGDPDCTCSYCGFVIPGDEVPIRLYHTCNLPDCPAKNKEARLHEHCFRLLMK